MRPEVGEPNPPPVHPLHRLSCLFFLTALFLLVIMLARACVSALCGAKPKAHIVLVPPEKSRFTAVKTAKRAPRAVQVAKPLA